MAELFIESQSGQSDLLNTVYSSEVTWGSAIPKGMIAPFGRTVPPEGWLICDGSTLNALQDVMYRSLYDAIGTTWGGTGENDFQIPDLRGQFLRGVDAGAGNDPDASSRSGGDSVSSTQSDEIKSHSHPAGNVNYGTNHWVSGVDFAGGGQSLWFRTGTDGGNETRPKNVAVLYCIKY